MPINVSRGCGRNADRGPQRWTQLRRLLAGRWRRQLRLADLIGRIGTQPTLRTVAEYGYLDAMRYFAGCSAKSSAECLDQASGTRWNREAFVASSRPDRVFSFPQAITSA